MAVRLDIRSNIREVSRGLDLLQRQQLPFAISRALNDSAFGVRKRIVSRTWPRADLEVRNRGFIRASMRVKKASKVKLRASVYDRLGRGFMPLQAEGGTKRPRSSSKLAVPINARRTAGGRIRKRDLPSSLRANPRAFLIRAKSGHQMIVERQGRARLPIRVLYHLTSSAVVDKSFAFYEDAEASSLRQFPRHFERRLRDALRTARR